MLLAVTAGEYLLLLAAGEGAMTFVGLTRTEVFWISAGGKASSFVLVSRLSPSGVTVLLLHPSSGESLSPQSSVFNMAGELAVAWSLENPVISEQGLPMSLLVESNDGWGLGESPDNLSFIVLGDLMLPL